MLLSCSLAAEFNKDKQNTAIRNTLRIVRDRVESPRIKQVCTQGIAQMFPIGWLQRQYNNVGRVGGMSCDQFIKIGASL